MKKKPRKPKKLGYAGSVYTDIDDALEDIQIDDPDDYHRLDGPMAGWFAVSTGNQGTIAYTRSERLAYSIRLCLINAVFNHNERGEDLDKHMPRKPKKRKHTFAPVAPELVDGGDAGNGEAVVWEWCIRCGVLRLGDEHFVPGPKQSETLRAAEHIPLCPPDFTG